MGWKCRCKGMLFSYECGCVDLMETTEKIRIVLKKCNESVVSLMNVHIPDRLLHCRISDWQFGL